MVTFFICLTATFFGTAMYVLFCMYASLRRQEQDFKTDTIILPELWLDREAIASRMVELGPPVNRKRSLPAVHETSLRRYAVVTSLHHLDAELDRRNVSRSLFPVIRALYLSRLVLCATADEIFEKATDTVRDVEMVKCLYQAADTDSDPDVSFQFPEDWAHLVFMPNDPRHNECPILKFAKREHLQPIVSLR